MSFFRLKTTTTPTAIKKDETPKEPVKTTTPPQSQNMEGIDLRDFDTF